MAAFATACRRALRVRLPWGALTALGQNGCSLTKWHGARGLVSGPPHEWRLWAALDERDELIKLRLAQLMHDLQDLAAEQQFRSSADLETVETQQLTAEPQQLSPTNISYRDPLMGELDDNLYTLPCLFCDATLEDVRNAVAAFADNKVLGSDCFMTLLEAGADLLGSEPTVLNLRSREMVHVVGDLHGSILCLEKVLQAVGLPSPDNAIVFNGDFVDRGRHGAEVVASLLLLKSSFPEDVFLLRGNHEDGHLATAYGFKEEITNKYKAAAPEIWEALLNVFGSLPLCAVTPEAFIVHGGLPTPFLRIQRLEEITPEERKHSSVVKRLDTGESLDTLKQKLDRESRNLLLLQRMLWADPSGKSDGVTPNPKRGKIVTKFGNDVIENFLTTHGLNYLVRSHEAMYNGWSVQKTGGKTAVFTVFSAANYPADGGKNHGAVLRLQAGHEPEPTTFKLDPMQKFAAQICLSTAGHQTLVELVIGHIHRLQHAFQAIDVAGSGRVTMGCWAEVMKKELGINLEMAQLEQVFRDALRACVLKSEIDFKLFFQQCVRMHQRPGKSQAKKTSANPILECLYRNHKELSMVFRFLDKDGDGLLSFEEFSAGIDLLNERLPASEHMTDADELFKFLDVDGDGQIEMDEFYANFKS